MGVGAAKGDPGYPGIPVCVYVCAIEREREIEKVRAGNILADTSEAL